MKLETKIKKIVEKALGIRVYRRLPGGVSMAYDVQTQLPATPVNTIFDVGANIGQSAEDFVREFEANRVYCFEPSTTTYHTLREKHAGDERIQCFRLALGSEEGQGTLSSEEKSALRSILNEEDGEKGKESVQIRTVDSFCEEHGIAEIDLLKIDTEGHDLKVLRGAENMLRKAEISLVQVEASMNKYNTKHVAFGSIKDFLEGYDYLLFKIYDQTTERGFRGKPHLRRTNPLFISRRVIEDNSR